MNQCTVIITHYIEKPITDQNFLGNVHFIIGICVDTNDYFYGYIGTPNISQITAMINQHFHVVKTHIHDPNRHFGIRTEQIDYAPTLYEYTIQLNLWYPKLYIHMCSKSEAHFLFLKFGLLL
jgi:hypothetical protein